MLFGSLSFSVSVFQGIPKNYRPGIFVTLPSVARTTYNPQMRYLLALILLISLTACGFHLRGSVQLPPELTEMALQDASPATDILPELRRALKNENIRLSETAPLVLQLKSERYGKRVLSVDSSGRAQEYGLSYTVRFLLKREAMQGENDAVWLTEQAVTESRDLRFDANAVLGTASEEALLKTEMRRDAVLQILRRLQKAKRQTPVPELK
ncbi:MAG: LPS assembly lipoprotein LptE [Gammaproteobacteria bacterium]|nr:LPS assembly lipoprotein LptE [Gammaproteobacteria bacterium]